VKFVVSFSGYKNLISAKIQALIEKNFFCPDFTAKLSHPSFGCKYVHA